MSFITTFGKIFTKIDSKTNFWTHTSTPNFLIYEISNNKIANTGIWKAKAIPSRFTSRSSNYCIYLIPVNYTLRNYTNITLTRCSISYMFRLLTANLREKNYHEVIILKSVHFILNGAPLNCYLQTIFRISTIHRNIVRVYIELNTRLKIIDIYKQHCIDIVHILAYPCRYLRFNRILNHIL